MGKKLIREVINNFYAVWLGASLAAVGITVWQWKYWLVTAPTIIFVAFRRSE